MDIRQTFFAFFAGFRLDPFACGSGSTLPAPPLRGESRGPGVEASKDRSSEAKGENTFAKENVGELRGNGSYEALT